jgi:transposase-like protein
VIRRAEFSVESGPPYDTCPQCGSGNCDIDGTGDHFSHYVCQDCGMSFWDDGTISDQYVRDASGRWAPEEEMQQPGP